MSAVCPTCHSALSCGCQKRRASNGVTVCTLCQARYEQELKAKQNINKPGTSSPTNVKATYIPPNP